MTDGLSQYTFSDSMVNSRQRGIQSFAFIISVLASVVLCFCFVVSGLGDAGQSEQMKLKSRINPNEASPASLVRLPGIGITRAGAIVAYRENSAQHKQSKILFEDCNDLQKVKGIGPKTAQNISQWLKFE